MAKTHKGSRQEARLAYAAADTWARNGGPYTGAVDDEGRRRAKKWLPAGLPALSTVLKQLCANETQIPSGDDKRVAGEKA